MNIVNDFSVNTIIISLVVALVGWGLKGVAWGLGELIKQLIVKLVQTITKVEALEKDLSQVVGAVGDVQKIRSDLNGFYDRLKEVEAKIKVQ